MSMKYMSVIGLRQMDNLERIHLESRYVDYVHSKFVNRLTNYNFIISLSIQYKIFKFIYE